MKTKEEIDNDEIKEADMLYFIAKTKMKNKVCDDLEALKLFNKIVEINNGEWALKSLKRIMTDC